MRLRRAAFLLAAASATTPAAAAPLHVDRGDTAWMLVATILVLMMILPGLALFYGGLVRTKNALSILSQVLGIAALAVLTWVGWGYSLAFGDGGAFVGGLGKAFLLGIDGSAAVATPTPGAGIPELVFAAFQMTFAAITAALIVGSLAERARFGAMMLFSLIWLTIVYAPIAHMVWSPSGLIYRMGALDFAGGTVVHINAGIAGLVGVLFAGKRIGFLREAMPPHSLALSVAGAGLLWVGWFGFNAGSALEASGVAAIAMMNTFVAPAAGTLAWMGAERIVSGRPSLLGGASGAVAGLVAVTPAAGTSGPLGAMLLGAAAALACYGFVGSVKHRLRLDDTLDVFGIHGLGGIIGSLGTALVTAPWLGGHGAAGYSTLRQLVVQLAAVAIAILWSAAGSAAAFWVVRRAIGLRAAGEAEREGLDLTDHGERAYNY
ncbi:MAG: ammonium transporter, Amt family [Sphingomonadales bacterium]|jgi:Amt family ammonium transporter|nr:ammonium transporter, Amt family [Sphingomonadales bacterium]